MTDQHGTRDLHRLLDGAAGAGPVTTDVRPDLLRGRRALARTRRRRGATGLVGVAAAGVVGLGAVDHISRHARPAAVAHPAPQPHRDPATIGSTAVALRAAAVVSGPYTFDLVPDGWEVGGQTPYAATFLPPDGDVDPDPSVFTGKLVVLLDQEGLGGGRRVTLDGRVFTIRSDSGYTTISVATRPDEQAGIVRAQFPDDTGWRDDLMTEFLDGVHVGAGARPGVG